ncbi:hypothetical protein [Bacillus sp. FJAT-45350]|nr:hypothetical protein [Bacillus sp. FJAT-45350]
MEPIVICPQCREQKPINRLLTAQSNQNVIFECGECHYVKRNIETKKG